MTSKEERERNVLKSSWNKMKTNKDYVTAKITCNSRLYSFYLLYSQLFLLQYIRQKCIFIKIFHQSLLILSSKQLPRGLFVSLSIIFLWRWRMFMQCLSADNSNQKIRSSVLRGGFREGATGQPPLPLGRSGGGQKYKIRNKKLAKTSQGGGQQKNVPKLR